MDKLTLLDMIKDITGLDNVGTAAIYGNIMAESSGYPDIMQGDFSATREKSKNYINNMINGVTDFAGWCRDGVGYGLCQWTYWTRKAGLYTYAGDKIDDARKQLEYMTTETEYKNCLPALKSGDLNTACDKFCATYENPAVKNYNTRRIYAKEGLDILNKMISDSVATDAEEMKKKIIDYINSL